MKRTTTVETSGDLEVRPEVFDFGNYEYWAADDTMTVTVDDKGRFISVKGKTDLRD